MANTKISALPAGTPAQSTDQIPVARSGANVKLLASDIAALSTPALTAETTRAEAAEATNATAISTETTRAEAAESAAITTAENFATSAVSAEVAARNIAIAVETTRAEAAESAAITTAESFATSAVSAEVTARNTAIAVETTRAEAAESTLTTNLSGEVTRAEAAEALLVPKTTTVNGHALSANVVVSASDLTTGTLPHAQLPALVSGDIPNNAANTSGTAANLSGTPALPNGTTATTQAALNNSTDVSTTSYADSAVSIEKTRALAAELLIAQFANTLVQSGLLAQYNMTDAGGSSGYILTDSSGNGNNGYLGDQAPITNLSLTTNVITLNATNDYTVGEVVTLVGLTTNPALIGTSLTVLSSGLSTSQFSANLTHANIASAAETGFAVVTNTVPTFIAGTGGLSFSAAIASPQNASLPAALNGAKTMMFLTFFDPANANNKAYGSVITPSTLNTGPALVYNTGVGTQNTLLGSTTYWPTTYSTGNAIETIAAASATGYVITTLTESAGGDYIYQYNVVSAQGTTIGQLASGHYLLGGGGGPTGVNSRFNGQILFAAFWSGTLTAAQVAQNVQALTQLMTQRGLSLNGTPGGGTWQTPDYVDTFVFVGDSETGQFGQIGSSGFPTITGSPNVFTASLYGQTAETMSADAPYLVDTTLPNEGSTVNGGINGGGANRAGIILFAGSNDENQGRTAAQSLGAIAKFCRDRKKVGWNKVYITTVMSGFGNANKNNYNALYRQNWSNWADGLLDIAAVPVLGSDSAAGNTFYFSDQEHWSGVGSMMGAWMYSYATRRMYGNTAHGSPNVASSSPYICQPEDVFWFANDASAISAYLIPAQFFTGQTVTVRNLGAGTLTLYPKPLVSSAISATSLTSTTLTVTVANNFTAGDVVLFAGLNTNTTKNGFYGIILAATATNFTMTVTAASWSGSDTAGTATLANMCEASVITNLSLTSNVATLTANNNYKSGDTVVLTGLTTTAGLNGTSATVSATGLTATSYQLAITHANIASGAETGFGVKTFAAETINGNSSITVASGATCVLLSQLSSPTTGLANWITLQNS